MEQQDHEAFAKKSLDRRSVVAVAAAAVTGAALAKLADADDAAASHDTDIAYGSQTVVHSDVTNTTAGSTRISSNISGTAAFVVLNNYPVGISRPDGMLGRTTYTTSNCAGVAGSCEAAAGGIGVLGTCNNATGCGVFGHSQSSVPFTPPPAGTGVHGEGRQRGISGRALTVDGVGVVAQGMGTSGKAALFIGSTRVEGVLEAVGAVPATVVQGSDGSSKRTYPHASLSPAFEHVGQANLRNGRARVKLPAGFDVLVPGRKYQVFLTEYGNLGGLYVARRNLHSFQVRSRRPGARGAFAYRVVAVRMDLRN